MSNMVNARCFTSLFVALFLLLLGAGAGMAANDRLVVVQDESAMERTIEAYLTKEHSLIIKEKTPQDDPNDLYLELPFKGDPMPSFKIVIDTQSLNTDKETKKIIERGILINLNTTVTVPKGHRAAILEILNDYNRRKTFCSVFIDSDGEIMLSWTLNVLSEGMATENVFDVVARIQNIWKSVYPDVVKELNQ